MPIWQKNHFSNFSPKIPLGRYEEREEASSFTPLSPLVGKKKQKEKKIRDFSFDHRLVSSFLPSSPLLPTPFLLQYLLLFIILMVLSANPIHPFAEHGSLLVCNKGQRLQQPKK